MTECVLGTVFNDWTPPSNGYVNIYQIRGISSYQYMGKLIDNREEAISLARINQATCVYRLRIKLK